MLIFEMDGIVADFDSAYKNWHETTVITFPRNTPATGEFWAGVRSIEEGIAYVQESAKREPVIIASRTENPLIAVMRYKWVTVHVGSVPFVSAPVPKRNILIPDGILIDTSEEEFFRWNGPAVLLPHPSHGYTSDRSLREEIDAQIAFLRLAYHSLYDLESFRPQIPGPLGDLHRRKRVFQRGNTPEVEAWDSPDPITGARWSL